MRSFLQKLGHWLNQNFVDSMHQNIVKHTKLLQGDWQDSNPDYAISISYLLWHGLSKKQRILSAIPYAVYRIVRWVSVLLFTCVWQLGLLFGSHHPRLNQIHERMCRALWYNRSKATSFVCIPFYLIYRVLYYFIAVVMDILRLVMTCLQLMVDLVLLCLVKAVVLTMTVPIWWPDTKQTIESFHVISYLLYFKHFFENCRALSVWCNEIKRDTWQERGWFGRLLLLPLYMLVRMLEWAAPKAYALAGYLGIIPAALVVTRNDPWQKAALRRLWSKRRWWQRPFTSIALLGFFMLKGVRYITSMDAWHTKIVNALWYQRSKLLRVFTGCVLAVYAIIWLAIKCIRLSTLVCILGVMYPLVQGKAFYKYASDAFKEFRSNLRFVLSFFKQDPYWKQAKNGVFFYVCLSVLALASVVANYYFFSLLVQCLLVSVWTMSLVYQTAGAYIALQISLWIMGRFLKHWHQKPWQQFYKTLFMGRHMLEYLGLTLSPQERKDKVASLLSIWHNDVPKLFDIITLLPYWFSGIISAVFAIFSLLYLPVMSIWMIVFALFSSLALHPIKSKLKQDLVEAQSDQDKAEDQLQQTIRLIGQAVQSVVRTTGAQVSYQLEIKRKISKLANEVHYFRERLYDKKISFFLLDLGYYALPVLFLFPSISSGLLSIPHTLIAFYCYHTIIQSSGVWMYDFIGTLLVSFGRIVSVTQDWYSKACNVLFYKTKVLPFQHDDTFTVKLEEGIVLYQQLQYKPCDLTLKTGTMYVIKGANGTGKSVLFRLLSGYGPRNEDAPDAPLVSMTDHALYSLPQQTEALMGRSTIEYILGQQAGDKVAQEQVAQWAEALSLFKNQHNWMASRATPSGGQLQKMALLRLFYRVSQHNNPDKVALILVDEGFSQLDQSSVQIALDILKTLCLVLEDRHQKTIIFTITHHTADHAGHLPYPVKRLAMTSSNSYSSQNREVSICESIV